MVNGYIVTSIITAVAFILLGLGVLLRNPQSKLNRRYLWFSIFTAFWLVTNYVGGNASVSSETALGANRLLFFFGCLSTFMLLIFVKDLTEYKLKKAWIFICVINAISVIGSLTPLIVNSVHLKAQTYSIGFGLLSTIYFLTLLTNCVLIVALLLLSRKKARGIERAQINTILLSLAITLGGVLITNALLPATINYYSLTNVGSFFTIFLVVGMAYSIIKHKLFDIRFFVVRATTYVLSVGTIGLVYGFITFGIIGSLFFSDQRFNFTQRLVYTSLAVVLMFTFPTIQQFFNKVTNRLFYQDAYDQQALLNKLGTLFALEIDIKKIARQSLDIICTDMKLQHGRLITINDNQSLRVTTHGETTNVTMDSKLLKGLKQKVTSVDDAELHIAHREELRALDVSVIVRLVTKEGLVGYLLLGPKKSGNIYGSQDVDVLTIISNEMAVAVQNSLLFERITQFNITLQARVDDATRRLRRTNEKLKELDETKDDFISMASHQLRTPLTSIKGYISMVMEEDAGKISKQQRDMLGQAFFSSQRMVYLIADLLNVSRLKTGKFIIDASPVKLAEIVPQELEQLKETAASRQLSLTFEAAKDFPEVMLDETKTRQVIMNFVDNAIYYTPAGGHIKIRLIDNPHAIELRVEDDGIGVSKTDQAHLFTKFYRAGNARKARPDGTGLGLFMAKKVIIAQGGSLIFESAEGKGSTFGFNFSKSRVGVKAAAAPVASAKPVSKAPASSKK